MSDIKNSESAVATQEDKLQPLVDSIAQVIQEARSHLAKQINSTMTKAYWQIGKYIVEYEQGGQERAEYGSGTIKELSLRLTAMYGRGYSRPNLLNMRKFYLMYPKSQTVSDIFSWSHICLLMQAEDELERSFYEKECIAQKWDVRTLQRQMKSALFLRLAASKDKAGILALASEGIQIQKPEDVVHDPLTLEFLNIPEDYHYEESELEQKIIDNLQLFLLEMGKGLTFVKRQYHMSINNRHFRCDLVFYHRILKCFVLIDLKRGEVQHEDIGQMNMYLGYFAIEMNMPDDNPPIGIILSHYKDDLMVEYATYGMNTNLFVQRYELYLPNKEQLRAIVNRTIEAEEVKNEE